MNELQTATGLQQADLAAQVAFAIQGTLIVFFVVAPVLGWLLARGVARRANAVLAWCCAVLVVLVGSFGLNWLLRRAIPPAQLPDVAVHGLSLAAALASGLLLARYLLWLLAEPGKAPWVIEHEQLQDDELLPFERRRKLEMARRKKLRGG
ncbi:MAG: hypothetical protein MUE40_14940 [Anaerolineae bacterium]|jgi:hypothetical protein|nr:hypothetical protein [Anaerolineae bacterium]